MILIVVRILKKKEIKITSTYKTYLKPQSMGCFIWTGLEGLSVSQTEQHIIQKYKVSGIILFKRNIKTLLQVFELCKQIHSLNPKVLIMIDREGGLVDRLKHLSEYPRWPAPADLAKVCSVEEIQKTAFLMAQELKALGICINFAPCVDILSVPNPLFNGRLWGHTVEQITKNSIAYFKGIKQAGLSACAKHFPGHGGVKMDSHVQLPVDYRELKQLHNHDLISFQKIIDAKIDMIMTAHILYPKVDPLKLATLSSVFLKDILRQKMYFKGLIVSDDLDMKALHNKKSLISDIMIQALEAGVDILLKCTPFKDLLSELNTITKVLNKKQQKIRLEDPLIRIQTFQKKYCLIKPVPSFEQLKQVVFNAKTHYWCDILNKRVKDLV